MFFSITDTFLKILSTKGYIVSKIKGAEADDLLYLWSRVLNSRGENFVLISGDRDLLQTVNLDKNTDAWTIVLDPVNKRQIISLTEEIFELSKIDGGEKADIFNTNTWSTTSSVLSKLITRYGMQTVDIESFRTKKILLGDGGDTVPPIMTWPDKKDPKITRKLTENTLDKILIKYPGIMKASWRKISEGEFAQELTTQTEIIKTIKLDKKVVEENMKRNALLVVLDEKFIPQEIQSAFKESTLEIPNITPITNKDLLLEGTEWLKITKTEFIPKSFDLFE
jgi:hypothetical protein